MEYSEQELCPGCRDLPPVDSFQHYQHILHDTFKSFLTCPCPFCLWLQRAQEPDLAPESRSSLIEENSVVGLLPNLAATPQSISLGDQMSNMGNLHSSNYVNVYFEVFTDPCEFIAERKVGLFL